MADWSDKIIVLGVGVSKEDTDKIKAIIVEKVINQPQLCYTGVVPREGNQMDYKGISTQTLESSLDRYYARLSNWDTTEEKRQKYINRIDDIIVELNKREVA